LFRPQPFGIGQDDVGVVTSLLTEAASVTPPAIARCVSLRDG
jgi:hypothetical protein